MMLIGALLAGCAGSPQAPAGPPSGPSSLSQEARAGSALPHSPLALLEQQAAGKIPGPIPRAQLRRQLEQLRAHPSVRYAAHGKAAKIGMWLANSSSSYLLGESKNAKTTITAVSTTPNGCYYPITVKVDAGGNVWTACEYNATYNGGIAQEYSSAGALVSSYSEASPACPPSSTCTFSGYGFDEASNAADVFDALALFSEKVCSPKCTTSSGSGFEYWPAGSPSATPALIALPYGSPVKEVYYMDVDGSGDIFFDYYGCASSSCGYGLGEIVAPTSASWTFVSVLPPGSLGFAGGVYVSDQGNTLNVIDQRARTIAQYALPGLTLSDTLGPTAQNAFGCGDPVSGAFGLADKHVAAGDACGWVDVGDVSGNTWKAVGGINFSGIEGAAFTPSDK